MIPDKEFDNMLTSIRTSKIEKVEKEVARKNGLKPHGRGTGGRPKSLDLSSHPERSSPLESAKPLLHREDSTSEKNTN